MEILTRDEFWARNPAPDTRFVELSGVSKVVGTEIDPDEQDPDDIVAVTFGDNDETEDSVIVLSWGSWDNHKDLIEQHNKGVASMKSEDDYEHVCEIGL